MKKILIFIIFTINIFSQTYVEIMSNHLDKFNIKNKDQIINNIIENCKKYNVNPLLVTAMMQQESGFKHNIKSSAGAIGILQLMPFTAKDLGVNPYSLEENILGGIKYISFLLEKNNRNIPLALASYNAGLGAVQKFKGIPPYKETQGYVKNIVNIFNGLTNNNIQINDKNDENIINGVDNVSTLTQITQLAYSKELNNVSENNKSINVNENTNTIRFFKADLQKEKVKVE